MKKLLLLSCSLLLVTFVVPAQPTDNVYKSKYHSVFHWTDSLNWSNTYDAQSAGVLPANDSITNIQNLRTLIAQVALAGGGVVYFKAGIYHLADSIVLKTGVVLRGETPAIQDAKNTAFSPPVKLVFPKYRFDTTANNGNGVSINTAFKTISADYNAYNIGLVWLDINRAGIEIRPHGWVRHANTVATTAVDGTDFNSVGTTRWPQDVNRNILVFGVRQNNVLIPDPGIPQSGTTKPWGRFAWRFGANIDLYVSANGVVCNNRVNDSTTDTYSQPYYISPPKGTPASVFTQDWSAFAVNYVNHYGIVLNRAKIHRYGPSGGSYGTGPNSNYGIFGFVTSATPEDEPYLFVEGNEIRDNYVYKNMRIGIQAAGNGLVIKGNQVRDNKNKVAWLSATGNSLATSFSNTFENRGIDFSGWNITIDSNDFAVYRHAFGMSWNGSSYSYYSVDGEGILLQNVSGGTSINDYRITNNTTNGAFISLFTTGDINNVTVSGNNLSGPLKGGVQSGSTLLILADEVQANSGGFTYYQSINNLLMENNINISDQLQIQGSRGGKNVLVKNNMGTVNPTLSCYVQWDTSNSGFGPVNYTEIYPGSTSGYVSAAAGPCNDTYEPTLAIVSPATDTMFCYTNGMTINIKARSFGGGIVDSMKVDFFIGPDKVAAGIPIKVNGADTSALFTFTPATGSNKYAVTAQLIYGQTGKIGYAPARNISVDICTGAIALSQPSNGFEIWPNPSENILIVQSTSGIDQADILDIAGKKYQVSVSNREAGRLVYNTSVLPPGIYFISLKNQSQTSFLKFVKL